MCFTADFFRYVATVLTAYLQSVELTMRQCDRRDEFSIVFIYYIYIIALRSKMQSFRKTVMVTGHTAGEVAKGKFAPILNQFMILNFKRIISGFKRTWLTNLNGHTDIHTLHGLIKSAPEAVAAWTATWNVNSNNKDAKFMIDLKLTLSSLRSAPEAQLISIK